MGVPPGLRTHVHRESSAAHLRPMTGEIVGRAGADLGGLTISDNLLPIQLVWEGLVSDAELDAYRCPMPLVRNNYRESADAFAAEAAVLDNMDVIEKKAREWRNPYR